MAGQLSVLFNIYIIVICSYLSAFLCKNNFSDFLSYERDSQEIQNQKQYVERLNQKVLAHERDRLERTFHQNSFRYPDDRRQSLFAQQNLHFPMPVRSLEVDIRKIANKELCITKMQAIFDTLPTAEYLPVPQDILSDISSKLTQKVKNYQSVLSDNSRIVESLYNQFDVPPEKSDSSCCALPDDSLIYNDHFGANVNMDLGCVSLPHSHTSPLVYMAQNLSSTHFKVSHENFPSLLWQYYISPNGGHFEYPSYRIPGERCDLKTDRHRHVYSNAVHTKPKHVIIAVDQGVALSVMQFLNAKFVGKHILSLLSAKDKVVILGVSDEVELAQGSTCQNASFLPATAATKLEFMRYFEKMLRKQGITNHMIAFQKSFDVIEDLERRNSSAEHEVLIAYVTRGLMSSLVDAKEVLEIISNGVSRSRSRIIINTYALIDDSRPLMYERQFLEDIAQQNYKKFNIVHKAYTKSLKGAMIEITKTPNVNKLVGDIFKDFRIFKEPKPLFSLPYYDIVSKGIIVSLFQQVRYNGEFMGVTGIDFPLADLTEDVVFFPNSNSLYVFLVDKSGVALTHPAFVHGTYSHWQHIHANIWDLEDKPGLNFDFKALLDEPSGSAEAIFQTKSMDGTSEDKVAIYHWERIEGSPYILCIVHVEPSKLMKVLKEVPSSNNVPFTYHRIDLLPTDANCRHMRQLSQLGTASIFLSAMAFESPYEYLMEEETEEKIDKYMSYLTSSQGGILNPGLKHGIKNEVLALIQIIDAWKIAAVTGEFSNYIIRRFIATPSGVLQVFPATVLDKIYDPTRRDWYVRALEHPGQIILSAPYLDAGGAGYVITLSHTIYEGKPAALHGSEDNVIGVMGLDFHFTFMYKFLLERIALCKEEHMLCFLVDDKGYLVSHPDFVDPTAGSPVEQQHITHKEPLIASDLLNHRSFAAKDVCVNYSERTIQRFYQLNTSLDSVLTNLVHGEQCANYQVTHLYRTNVFLGIINETCEGKTAFCPCSTSDELCLNCIRPESNECECPCECPLKIDMCKGHLINDKHYPTCPTFLDIPNLPVLDPMAYNDLEQCYDNHCSSRENMNDCLSVLGCEWCHMEDNIARFIPRPFCALQRKCFGGVLGAKSPYDDIVETLPGAEYLVLKNSPVASVIGALVLLVMVVLVILFFTRSRHSASRAPLIRPSPNSGNLRLAQVGQKEPVEEDEDESDSYNEPLHPPLPIPQILPRMDPSQSPYRVVSGCRRPTAVESDHGYSTMTQHDDSEPVPYAEPLLLPKPRTTHSVYSGSSRSSSPLSTIPSLSKPVGIVCGSDGSRRTFRVDYADIIHQDNVV